MNHYRLQSKTALFILDTWHAFHEPERSVSSETRKMLMSGLINQDHNFDKLFRVQGEFYWACYTLLSSRT